MDGDASRARQAGRAKRGLNLTLHLYPHQRGGWLWSPLRASSDHCFIVGALRAQRPHQLPRLLFRDRALHEHRRSSSRSLPLLPSSLASLSWNDTRVGPIAAVERAHSYRARSGSTGPTWVSFPSFLSWRLCKQEGWLHIPSLPSEAKLFPLQKGVARLSFTARVERAHSYRARSASKKDIWPLPSQLSA